MIHPALLAAGAAAAFVLARLTWSRLLLSRAKHPSLSGHARIAQCLARWIPYYEFDESGFFGADGASPAIAARRQAGFERLAEHFAKVTPLTRELGINLPDQLSDVAFTNAYRVPFQFRRVVRERLVLGSLLTESEGRRVRDADGNWAYDLSGSYGVNLLGYDFYKQCIDAGVARARALGPLLGSFHPVIVDNVQRLRAISGLDEVSFHMSGTEAVMQAVRLARYHTRRSHVVRFCGAYHGWWDGVQPGVGNPRPPRDIYTLREMDPRTLRVLTNRNDIACVLVNPLQAMHPNSAAASDSTLIASDRRACYDRQAYTEWLAKLRGVCSRRNIVLIFDEVFMGFRLARGGAQEYFGVRADLVTYGKTLGGGLPVGVLCGRRDLMRRYDEERPSDICFARGTFNSHPYVMATMNEFLRTVDRPEVRATYWHIDALWDRRAAELNDRLEQLELTVRVANMTSVWTTLYTRPSRYNWMFQYYLRAEGLALSWIGTGRFIFSHDFTEADFQEVAARFVAAARAMDADGWWSAAPSLTNKAIKRRVLREMLGAALGRRVVRDVQPVVAPEMEQGTAAAHVGESVGQDVGSAEQTHPLLAGAAEPRGADPSSAGAAPTRTSASHHLR